jgi:hypothetical protein
LLLDSRLSGFANGHDADHCRNADGYPQNREDASHLVSEQRHQRGAKESTVTHSAYASSGLGKLKRLKINENLLV